MECKKSSADEDKINAGKDSIQSKETLTNRIKLNKTSDVVNITSDKFSENSDQKEHPCDFCGTLAKFVCHFCMYKYCQCCRENLHPLVGPFRLHDVVSVDDVNSSDYFDQCDEHGLPEKLRCDVCTSMKCVECVSSKCRLHFKSKISDVDIEIEKRIILKEFERASSKLSFLGKYRNQLEEEALNLELNTMLKKEKVRQEFVSFHEMLIVKENAILEKLDKEMDTRLGYIRGTLLARVEKLEEEEISLTTTIMDLIQKENEEQFIQDHVSAKERCKDIDNLIRDFDVFWANNSTFTPSFLLDSRFSMQDEKRQLSEKLDVTLGLGGTLRFKQSVLHISQFQQRLNISRYLHMPTSIPPSTTTEFLVQVYNTDGVNGYSAMVSDLCVFDLDATHLFRNGTSYIIKVTPYHNCTHMVKAYCHQSGNPSHMLLLYGEQNGKYSKKNATNIDNREN